MARAIDADDLLKNSKTMNFEGYDSLYYVEVSDIHKTPTIDPVKQEWISVKDRLPTKEDANKGHYILAILKVEGYGNAWHWDMVANYPEAFFCWMPLPEPPKAGDHE